MDGIWTLARKMTSFRFPENVFVFYIGLGLRLEFGRFTENAYVFGQMN